MVEAIVPMVHGERRGWRATAGLHVMGAALAGGLVGLASGGLGAGLSRLGATPRWRAGGLAAVAAVAAAREVWAPRSRLPGRRGQVPRRWSEELGPAATGLLYGVGLGLGFATHVTTAAYWATVTASVALADPAWGSLLGALFGLVRAGAVVVLTWRLPDWDGVGRRQAQLDRSEPFMRVGTAVVLAALAGAAARAV